MNIIKFNGPIIEGEIDMDKTDMVCIPSKEKYANVDLCFKDGMNIQIGGIEGRSVSFEDRKKIGYEIEKRWNSSDYEAAIRVISEFEQSNPRVVGINPLFVFCKDRLK